MRNIRCDSAICIFNDNGECCLPENITLELIVYRSNNELVCLNYEEEE